MAAAASTAASASWRERFEQQADALDESDERVDDSDVRVKGRCRREGRPRDALAQLPEALPAGLVVGEERIQEERLRLEDVERLVHQWVEGLSHALAVHAALVLSGLDDEGEEGVQARRVEQDVTQRRVDRRRREELLDECVQQMEAGLRRDQVAQVGLELEANSKGDLAQVTTGLTIDQRRAVDRHTVPTIGGGDGRLRCGWSSGRRRTRRCASRCGCRRPDRSVGRQPLGRLDLPAARDELVDRYAESAHVVLVLLRAVVLQVDLEARRRQVRHRHLQRRHLALQLQTARHLGDIARVGEVPRALHAVGADGGLEQRSVVDGDDDDRVALEEVIRLRDVRRRDRVQLQGEEGRRRVGTKHGGGTAGRAGRAGGGGCCGR